MGQGLSSLQHFVLKQTAKQGVLFRDEIKEQFFDWKKPECPIRISAGLRPFLPPKFFEDERRDNVVSASTTRTLTRLERRGLISAHQLAKKKGRGGPDGIVLTELGRKYVLERFTIKPKKLKKAKDAWGEWTVLRPIG